MRRGSAFLRLFPRSALSATGGARARCRRRRRRHPHPHRPRRRRRSPRKNRRASRWRPSAARASARGGAGATGPQKCTPSTRAVSGRAKARRPPRRLPIICRPFETETNTRARRLAPRRVSARTPRPAPARAPRTAAARRREAPKSRAPPMPTRARGSRRGTRGRSRNSDPTAETVIPLSVMGLDFPVPTRSGFRGTARLARRTRKGGDSRRRPVRATRTTRTFRFSARRRRAPPPRVRAASPPPQRTSPSVPSARARTISPGARVCAETTWPPRTEARAPSPRRTSRRAASTRRRLCPRGPRRAPRRSRRARRHS
mmetsp:Transcript_9742/g.40930  ORF Transcript_9742/g.40930 Transcript_9742/m.40930 type:complete len:316 (-) Transcript_9742:370-1317(-)